MTDQISLTFDPFALPTSQHRAGLAGLVLLRDTLRRRGAADVPELDADGRSGLVRLTVSERTLATLLNEVYEATWEERPETKKRTKKGSGEVIPPLREETVEEATKGGKPKLRTVYIYPTVVPRARPLEALDMPAAWLKLWRDALWNTLRAKPLSRGWFDQRAEGLDADGKGSTWKELVAWQRDRARGRERTVELAGSLCLGAQATNAEEVPFRGRPDETLLLHFWPLVMGVAEARSLKLDGGQVREKTTGYAIVVPDVIQVTEFVEEFGTAVPQLDREMAGFRPRDGVVSLPAEGALEYLHRLGRLMQAKTQSGSLKFSVAGFDVYHLEKRGNNVYGLGNARVPADRVLLEKYEAIRGEYRHVLFRHRLLTNLLAAQPWYTGFGRLFSTQPHELFFDDPGRTFSRNVNHRLRADRQYDKEAEA